MSLKKFTQYKLLLLMLLSLCVLLPFIPDQAYHIPGPDIAKQNFHVIEFNDQGQPHDDKQWQGLRDRILQPHNDIAPELLIFVHGWHHSANPEDENFVAFEQFYRQMATSDKQRNLLGLYIGWRGDKYDPFWLDGSDDATSQIEPIDFPTILQRKRVAKRIGQQGLSQLFDKLDGLVSGHQLLRYTVIGHSLGGSVVLHASKDRIQAAIDNGQDNPNLFLLLNPAVPAKDYRPLDRLVSLDRQKPSMVVLQSKGDFAVKEAFNYIKEGERAVGNSWAITHDIDKCSGGNCNTPMKMPSALMAHDQIPGCMMTLPHSGWKVRARLQARRTVQTCPDANMQAVWVLAVSDEIVSGHNGILTSAHAKALSEVMNMIDLYRNQLPKHAVESPANQDLGTLTPASEPPSSGETDVSVPEEPVVIVEPLPKQQSSLTEVQESPEAEESPPPIIDPELEPKSEIKPKEDVEPQPENIK
ncbi:thioesterase [Shewanella profunda]|uniref:thioesterase n=1 Tax=Shewanella profunda TaxID=254793 RepID=UPI00200F95A5|nr:thioesterase [Shewanella profunda]MCL1088946.1 thioesterase [Shewanella profunda]